MRAPETISTARLRLRRPVLADAPDVLAAYAGDPDVTRLVAWPRHTCLDDTNGFIGWSDQAWADGPAGPYLIQDRDGAIIGSTGLDVETPYRAATGFVLARHAWGSGYGTETGAAMAELADQLGITRLYALCHTENLASAGVLRKVGFDYEGVLRGHTVFPGLDPYTPHDVQCWARLAPPRNDPGS